MIKTVLAPNAPWPYNKPKAVKVKPQPAPKVRRKSDDTDDRFEAWLKSITPIVRKV